MCKTSLPPAMASAQCHICHPFLLILLILPPLESAPACRPRPPADEDLERKDCLLTLSLPGNRFLQKSSHKDKLSIDNLCSGYKLHFFTKVPVLGHFSHSLKNTHAWIQVWIQADQQSLKYCLLLYI